MKFRKQNKAPPTGDANDASSKALPEAPKEETMTANLKTNLLQISDNHIFVTVRPPWNWVMQNICQNVNQQPHQAHITLLDAYPDLPSGKLASINTSSSSSRANIGRPTAISSSRRGTSSARRVKPTSAASLQTLRIDVVTNHQSYQRQQENQKLDLNEKPNRTWTLQSFHATSEAFDGLEDKDEFVRTLQRCRCEHLELSPPSVLINWDASAQECKNLVGESMPTLLGNEATSSIGVLKEPMGKSGAGVFFVHDAEEIHQLMDRNRKRAVEEPGLLDELIAEKGRIPSWVLQAEVKPCLLIRDRRKFHIRTYVVCIENVILDSEGDQDDEDLMKLFIYDKHEIRIANKSVPEDDTSDRDRNVHIMDASVERKQVGEEPELLERNLHKKCELFAAKIFDKHLRPDIERRIALSASAMEEENAESMHTMVIPHKFVVAGLDLMVTEDERIYLLEVNVNPSAPDAESVSADFQKYLLDFQNDLLELVVTKGDSAKHPNSSFLSARSILERKL
ncbi:tubulin-tyrosine ligase family protein [Nitzschia inconspicua]|uniref:Tubulin--tyrosine ligase n=1 Tax=Nitzschia inconspicua TaxID=303405 RepID=A0A9K3PX86_9STRA|nr:tubulin-tyrosine ligase family protein [Nitzschia inconspicua]